MESKRRLVAVFCTALLLLAGCAAQPLPPPTSIDDETYRIGPPDELEVKILPEPAIVDEVTVRPDGMISVELIGDVLAQGRTTSEVAADIQERIARFKRNANVTVKLHAAQSPTIVIFGQVGRPGVFPLQRETRVAEALGIVGGATIFAAKGGIRVVRTDGQETEVHQIDLGAIQGGDLTTNIVLEQGDIVVVPPNAFAKVGFALQTILLPLTQVGSTAAIAVAFGGF